MNLELNSFPLPFQEHTNVNLEDENLLNPCLYFFRILAVEKLVQNVV